MITKADMYLINQSNWYLMRNFFRTFDEHEQYTEVKSFPDWFHLEMLSNELDKALIEYQREKECQIIAVPKSRQMMVSWLMCGWSLGHAMKRGNQSILFQSKREKDAIYQVRRVRFLYENMKQKDYFHQQYPLLRSLNRQKESGIEFRNGSTIAAIPQGGDIVHSRVPTVLFSDECAYQPELEDSYKAAVPCSQLIVLVSSAAPGYFQRLVEDTDGDIDEIINAV